MSEILEVVETFEHGIAPRLRVKCAGCGAIYVTTSWKKQVREATTCKQCRPRVFPGERQLHRQLEDAVRKILGPGKRFLSAPSEVEEIRGILTALEQNRKRFAPSGDT